MPGIDDLKNKTKLSIDEMYDFQSVGKPDNQQTGKPEIQQELKQTTKKTAKPINVQTPPDALMPNRFENQAILSKPLPINPSETLSSQLGGMQEVQYDNQIAVFPTTKQPPQKIPTYKMTFNLNESIFKAFNDLYAKRILQGRKTEKSELITEAIQWLLKMEENHS